MVASGRLVSVLDEFAAPPNGIYAVFPHAKHLPLRVRLWIDFVKQRYADPRYWKLNPAGPPQGIEIPLGGARTQ